MAAEIRNRPAHFSVEAGSDDPPSDDAVVPGRIQLTTEELVCVASPSVSRDDGMLDRLDDETRDLLQPGQAPRGTALNWVDDWGQLQHPHNFDVDEARDTAPVQAIPLAEIGAVNVRHWEGHELRGENHTYVTEITDWSGTPRVHIQLGDGPRNRGSGKPRHAALARDIHNAVEEHGNDIPTPRIIAGTTDVTVVDTTETPANVTESASSKSTTHQKDSPSEDGESESSPPTQTDEDSGTAWLQDPPTLTVVNELVAPQTLTVGWRPDKGETVTTEVTIDPGDEHEWSSLPESGEFEIGITIQDGATATRRIDANSVLGKTIEASLTQAGIDISVPADSLESNREGDNSEPTLPQSASPSETEPAPDSDQAGAARTSEVSQVTDAEPADQTSENGSTRVEEPVAEAGPSSGPLILLILGAIVVIGLPFVGMPSLGAERSSVAVAFPSIIGGLALLVYTQTASVSAAEINILTYIVQAIILPIVLIIDMGHVWRQTDWKPNRILYPLGILLIWFITLPVYLWRRRRAGGT